jgi:hypothetical protein
VQQLAVLTPKNGVIIGSLTHRRLVGDAIGSGVGILCYSLSQQRCPNDELPQHRSG